MTKKRRIEKLLQKGLKAKVIANKVGCSINSVYCVKYHWKRFNDFGIEKRNKRTIKAQKTSKHPKENIVRMEIRKIVRNEVYNVLNKALKELLWTAQK